MKIIVVTKADLNVASRYEADAPMQSNYGGPWGNPDLTVHLACPEELDIDCIKAIWENDQIIIVVDEYKIAAKLATTRESKLNQIRALRDPKLSKIDQLVNIAVLDAWSAPEKAELKAYRLALLNMTEAYKADMSLLDALDVATIEFPVEPTAE